jgi:hypothetical protein
VSQIFIDFTGGLRQHFAMRTTSSAHLSALLAVTVVAIAAPAAAPPTSRTVYVTVLSEKSEPVGDLDPADFVVKEGGKERQIVKIEPAPGRIRLTLAVEERLVGDTATRQAIWEFMKRMTGIADIRFVVIGLRNVALTDYTVSLDALVTAINGLTLNPSRDSAVAEGVLEIARQYADTKPERPAFVVVAFSGGQAGVEARAVLDKLRDSGATMHAVTLDGGFEAAASAGALGEQSGREQVLGDGPKQSGGRRVNVRTPNAIPKALQQIADDLSAQYAVTYTLPDGVRPARGFSIATKRRGLSLRAPSAIPDR